MTKAAIQSNTINVSIYSTSILECFKNSSIKSDVMVQESCHNNSKLEQSVGTCNNQHSVLKIRSFSLIFNIEARQRYD